MYRLLAHFKEGCNTILVSVITMICAYFESTFSFMTALMLGFSFNVLAGLKADDVKIQTYRLCNFKGNKLRHSLSELFLVVIITYFLKLIADKMGRQEVGIHMVEWLVWVQLYYYIRNGLKNITKVYPQNRWIRFVYNLISFKFNEIAPESIKKAMEKTEEDIKGSV